MINFVIKSPKIKQIEVLKVAKKTIPKKTAKKAVEKKTAKKKTTTKKVAAKRQTKTKPATLSVNDVIIESILEKKGEKITSIDFKKFRIRQPGFSSFAKQIQPHKFEPLRTM